jgi:hypothetical protein
MVNEMIDDVIDKAFQIVLFWVLVIVAVVTFGVALWYFGIVNDLLKYLQG